MISKTLNFDLCVFVQHDKGKLPKTIKEAVKSYYCKESICRDVVDKAIFFEYPIIEKINTSRIKNEVFGSSFSFIGEKKTDLTKYFDEFVMIPLNELDENKINYILCLNRIDKKNLNKKTISQLTVFQNQILSTLKNVILVNDIKEDYKEIRELHSLSYRLNLVTLEDKIIQNAFEEVMNFFSAKAGAVYVLLDKLPKLLFSKKIAADNESAQKTIINIMSEPKVPNKTVISSSDMPDFVNYGILSELKSQILIFVSPEAGKEYLFLLQSSDDYLRKRKNKILSEIICVTITRILENARMHQEIINYNEILLADKKMLSDAIIEDREKLFNIVNGMDEPLIAFNSDWIIEIFNDAAESMFGTDKENIVKTDAKIFIKQWRLPINLAEHLFKKRTIEYTINDKFYKIIKTPYHAKNGKHGTVLVFENVTKEREVEEMKNEFISLLSHEMKTPLTSITGFSKLLLTGKLGNVSDQQKECIDVIHDEGERLKNLVEEILDIDRLEKGKLTLNKTSVNLVAVFCDTLDNKIMLKNRDVKIIKDFPPKVPMIMVDEDKIRQVLINLVSNAIKFTDDGGSVTVTMTNTDKEIVTSVSDTGVGMKQEDLKYIFEKFYQVQSHLTRSQGGVGLGLSIVKKIIDLHNAHIDVKSKLGKGSTFTFYLPIKS
jgi:signal transduction histidine kinase